MAYNMSRINRYLRFLDECKPLDHPFTIGNFNLNSENTIVVNLRDCEKTTKMIDRFLMEDHSFLILERSFECSYADPQRSGLGCMIISLICQLVPDTHPAVRKGGLPSITMLKQAARMDCDVRYLLECEPRSKLIAIASAIVDAVEQNGYERERYLLEDPVAFQAQCSADRRGFRKEWDEQGIVYEKNYGDCSLYFSVIGFQSY